MEIEHGEPLPNEPTLIKNMPKYVELPEGTCGVVVKADLIQKVKEKANGPLDQRTASGVIDWLIHRYLNPEGVQP